MPASALALRMQYVTAPNTVPALACPGTPGLAMYRDVRVAALAHPCASRHSDVLSIVAKTGCRELPLQASHSDGYDLPSRAAPSRTCPVPMCREIQWSLSHIPVFRDTRTSCPSSREAGRCTGMYECRGRQDAVSGRCTGMYECRGRQDAVSGRRKRPASGTLVQYSGL
jgi:hypothetical protein